MKIVSWFSAGVSSAVATKMLIDEIDEIYYIHIDDHHPDNDRFIMECQEWFGKPIIRIQSEYMNVEYALRGAGGRGYVNGPTGAPCTRFLKRRLRQEWEMMQTDDLTYVWGMDSTEKTRCDRLCEVMPGFDHRFPLVERDINKADSHKILKASGIKRPAMYDLGYPNNNCIGCVKGGKGYWNKIRQAFPDVFASRAKVERLIGGSCIKGIYLDELPLDAGRLQVPICEDCGIFCGLMAL